MKHRVVITGMGVVAPNGVGLSEFTNAIKKGVSGITYHQNLKDLDFFMLYWWSSPGFRGKKTTLFYTFTTPWFQ